MRLFVAGVGLILSGIILTQTQRIIQAIFLIGDMRWGGPDPISTMGLIVIVLGIILCVISIKLR